MFYVIYITLHLSFTFHSSDFVIYITLQYITLITLDTLTPYFPTVLPKP